MGTMSRRLSLVSLLLALLPSCDSGPVAGDLALSYQTPGSDDQAIRFTITADASLTLNDITATCAGCQASVRKLSDTEIRAIVYGSLTSGNVALVSVSDVRVLSGYTIQLHEVSDGDLNLPEPDSRTLSLSSLR